MKYTKAAPARISSTMNTALKKASTPIAIPDPLAPLVYNTYLEINSHCNIESKLTLLTATLICWMPML